MTTSGAMEKDHIERILSFTLEIICLLTGEKFRPVYPGDHVTITVPSVISISRKDSKQKVLDVINNMVALLTGEVPVRCQDVAVYLSMEERQYLDGHKELYKAAMMEDQPMDGSRESNPPAISPPPPPGSFFQDSAHEDRAMLQLDQKDDAVDVAAERKADETPFWGDAQPALMVPLMEAGGGEEPSTDLDAGHGLIIKEVASSPIWITDDEDQAQDPAAETIFPTNIHQSPYPAAPPFHAADLDQLFGERPDAAGLCDDSQGEKKFSCLECGRCFSFKSNLVAHYRMHTGERPFQCSECGKGFVHKYSLTAHRRYHTGEKLHACTVCGKKFSLKSDLHRHHKSHTGEKPHRCSECGKCFVHKFHLYAHERSHAGEKPYPCPQCGKSFLFKSQLDAHQRFHTGQTPFSCPECGKNFMWRRDLIQHLRVHTREKPHSCSDCGKSFSSKSDLTRHKKGHTGEKPHTCPECGKSFIHKFSLTTHMRSHAAEVTLTV